MKLLPSLSVALVALTTTTLAIPTGAGVHALPQPHAQSEESVPSLATLQKTINIFDEPGVRAEKAYYASYAAATSLTDDELWQYSKAYYEALESMVKKTPGERILVAVIYAPGMGVFMGSNPTTTKLHDEKFEGMISAVAKQWAPEEYRILEQREEYFVSQRGNDGGKQKQPDEDKPDRTEGVKPPENQLKTQRVHSEDFAYIMAKKTLRGARFPSGTKGAVWGIIDGRVPIGPQNTCGRTDQAKVNPSCTVAQAQLGITYLTKDTYHGEKSQPGDTSKSSKNDKKGKQSKHRLTGS